MDETQIRLAAFWITLMLTYLLGDVLRIFAGDFKPGEIGGVRATPALWLAAAVIMLVPIAMILVSVAFVGQPARWAHVIAAAGLLVFNLAGVRGYPGAYDRFLIVVGLALNLLTAWTAWNWEVV